MQQKMETSYSDRAITLNDINNLSMLMDKWRRAVTVASARSETTHRTDRRSQPASLALAKDSSG